MDTVRLMRHLHGRLEGTIAGRHGLSGTEAAVLAFLHNNPGRDTLSDISYGRHMRKGNVSMAVSSLEDRGFVERRLDGSDRRVMHLSPTVLASPFLEELDDMMAGLSSAAFSGFSPSDRKNLARLMERLEENMREQYGKR